MDDRPLQRVTYHDWGPAYYCQRCGIAAQAWVETYEPCISATNVRSIQNELALKYFRDRLDLACKQIGYVYG